MLWKYIYRSRSTKKNAYPFSFCRIRWLTRPFLLKNILPQLRPERPKTDPSSLLYKNVPKSEIFWRIDWFWGPVETVVVAPVLTEDAILQGSGKLPGCSHIIDFFFMTFTIVTWLLTHLPRVMVLIAQVFAEGLFRHK